MFRQIFSYELRYGFRKVSTYIYFAAWLTIGLFFGLLLAGVFPLAEGDRLTTGNSAVSVASFLIGSNADILGLFNSIILITTLATAIQKDYQYNMHPLLFTKPISKAGYFFGRFLGAMAVAVFIFLAPVLGYAIGCAFGAGTPAMGPFLFQNFLQPFLIFVLPNIFLQGIIFFSLTTFLRNTLPAYLAAIIILVVQTISGNILADLDNKTLASILEPTGQRAFAQMTEYWSPAQRNSWMIPFKEEILYNRLVWTGLALLIMFISYAGFKFTQFLQPFSWMRRKEQQDDAVPVLMDSIANLPKAQQHFAFADKWKAFWYLVRFDLKKIIRSPFFLIMVSLGVAMVIIIAQYLDAMYGTPTYPVTYIITDVVAGAFSLFIIIFVVFYAGTLVWREREQKVDELIGATPTGNGALFFSKVTAIVLSVSVILVIGALCGILVQVSKGFYHIDIWQYLMMVLDLTVYFGIVAILCMAVQTIVSNKYLGFFISLIPVLLLGIIFSLLQWENDLYHFNSSAPELPYSDMNGYGGKFTGWLIYKGYWLSIVLVISFLALLFFARGKEKSLKARFRLAKSETKRWQRWGIGVFSVTAIALGSFIFYQTRILQKYYSPSQQSENRANAEKKYKHFEKLPQPRITATFMKVDIFPEDNAFYAEGYYWLRNNTSLAIDTLFIDYSGGEKSSFTFSKMEPPLPFTIITSDQRNGVRVLKLQHPLQPGDSVQFNIQMHYKPIGIFNGGETMVVGNGSFFNSSVFPTIGYNAANELSSNKERKKYGLKEKDRMAKIDDTAARMNNYISHDADWIRFETIVSTRDGQIALAPGYLQKDWKEEGRHYFHYKMDSPILNFYSYLSADYLVKRDKWNDVNIEIYYQKGHEFNLERMNKAIKKSLDYFTANFGPYQHKQVRILEFPRYASFAQSFPNTIPFSEAIGFLSRVEDDPDKIDMPFYVTSHEVAHQWWAHQVIGGDVQGSVVMSESMSQYSALMVMEKEYGKKAMRKFLKYELDQYLKGRTFESKKELPLMLVENQGYIHYNKGSLILYALRDYLGEDVLNHAIRGYLDKTRFAGPMYTNAVEFVDAVDAATPDSLKYLIRDFFKEITIYENYIKDLKYEKEVDGKYKVTLTVGSVKFFADSTGKDKRVAVNDYMDIGIFSSATKKGKPVEKELLLQRVKMDQPEKTFVFIVDEKPESAGIDPYNKLIDRKPDNNTYKFGSKPPAVDVSERKQKGIMINISD